MSGSNEFSIFAEERRVIDGKEHTHGRLINSYSRQCFRIFKVGNGIANIKTFQTSNGTDVTCLYALYFLTP